MNKKILIIDDDRAVCSSLKLLMSKRGFSARAIHYPAMIEETMADFCPDLVLLDMNFSVDTSGRQGLKAMDLIMVLKPDTHILLMTGWATVQLAVEGMKKGARDFIAKPWDNTSLMLSILTIFELEDGKIVEKDQSHFSAHDIIGGSMVLQTVVQQALRIAQTDASVLITGESGTGKELLAELIHQNSKRADHPFVKVNLGGISQSLFESEMFGHKKGAFTGAHSDRVGRFQKAHRGTIFLDEIGELDLPSQVKLLRVLQEKTYEVLGSSQTVSADIRVISATNRDLKSMILDGAFREDLYYRVNLIHLHLPSLDERREDIPLLVEHFKNRVCTNYGLENIHITPNALKWLQSQSYPGNIRQLSNVVERTLLMNIGQSKVEETAFKAYFSCSESSPSDIVLPDVGKISLEEMERQMIIKTLQHHQNSISQSARSLGLTRSALYRRLEKFNISYEGSI